MKWEGYPDVSAIWMVWGLKEISRGRMERTASLLDGLLEDNSGVHDGHTDVVNDDGV